MFHVSTLLPFSRDNRQQVCILLYIVFFSFFVVAFKLFLHLLHFPQCFLSPLSLLVDDVFRFLFHFPNLNIRTQRIIICKMNSTNLFFFLGCYALNNPLNVYLNAKANRYHIPSPPHPSHFHAKYIIKNIFFGVCLTSHFALRNGCRHSLISHR